MTLVGMVGLGAMGSRIARRLLGAGYELVLWNRTAQKASDLAALGARVAGTPADCGRRADVVITMVADPRALRDVTKGSEGLGAGVGPDTTIIEMSTVGPAAVMDLASTLPQGTPILDAPVLGSLGEAESGSLHVFVGGPDALVARWTPLLSVLGSVNHVGPLGAGAAAKLVANTTLFGVLGALGEALALARALGLPGEKTFEVLSATPLAAQADRRRASFESGDYPRRFALSLARKDLGLILEAAKTAGADLRVIPAMETWLEQAEMSGWGERDYSSVLALIAEEASRSPGGR